MADEVIKAKVDAIYDRNGNEIRREPNGRWQKGYCPNPLGRPNPPEGFKITLRNNAMVALETIIGIMNDPEARAADRIRAAEVILERCYGKAVQPFSGEDGGAPLVIKLAGALDEWSK